MMLKKKNPKHPLKYTHNTFIVSLYVPSSWLSVGKDLPMRIKRKRDDL